VKKGERIYFSPCLPADWDRVKVTYRYISTVYQIEVLQSDANTETIIVINGHEQRDGCITLTDDGFTHEVKVMVKNNNNIFTSEAKKPEPVLL
jgi:cellobiose phosphorylase